MISMAARFLDAIKNNKERKKSWQQSIESLKRSVPPAAGGTANAALSSAPTNHTTLRSAIPIQYAWRSPIPALRQERHVRGGRVGKRSKRKDGARWVS